MNVLLLQLQPYIQHPTVANTVNSINQLRQNLNDTVIEDTLYEWSEAEQKKIVRPTITLEFLRKLHSALGTSNTEGTRLKPLLNLLFAQQMDEASKTETAMKLCTKALEHAVSMAFHQSYYTDACFLDWATYTNDILKAFPKLVGNNFLGQFPRGVGSSS